VTAVDVPAADTPAAHFDMRRPADPHVDAAAVTPLEELAAELAAPDRRTVTLLVESRPGWSVLYSLAIDGPQLAGWRRAAKDENADTGVDEWLWQRTICAAQCVEIRRGGAKVTDRAGKPLTFFSETLWSILKVPAGAPSGATEAVRKFYANDFDVAAVSDEIVSRAGFGKKAREAPDPTPGSSSF
jgi:hypothetical protein